MPSLVVTVHFHEGRFHGRGPNGAEWPPSPARLFQALVAGAAEGKALTEESREALGWLERLAPPVIAAPAVRKAAEYKTYVPNNDLDSVGRDPARVSEIRTPKIIAPVLFDAARPVLFVWAVAEEDRPMAARAAGLADRLYQLGRGVDMAWASGEVLDDDDAARRLAEYDGPVYRPAQSGKGRLLAAPAQGSLASLIARHEQTQQRFRAVYETKPTRKEPDRKVPVGERFHQPPKPRFVQVAYNASTQRWLFEFADSKALRPQDIADLTERIRDAACHRLARAVPDKAGEIDHALIGREAGEADKAIRIRITPLPSIGHTHADRWIRRVLVEAPPNCAIPARDVVWAFSGLSVTLKTDEKTGEILDELMLVPADDTSMLRHYGIADAGAEPAFVWRSVTPVALPSSRRRIDPAAREAEAKSGGERTAEEATAAAEVTVALRHAGADAHARVLRVQREPFAGKGARAESFAYDRFGKHRLWHVEIAFDEPQSGPLLLGDGRYMGLGLMAPATDAVAMTEGVMAFAVVSGMARRVDAIDMARALRRAVMARVGGGEAVPRYVSGHEDDGAPARSGTHDHLSYVYDAAGRRLLVIAPHVLERRAGRHDEAREWAKVERAMVGFADLRAGSAGCVPLRRTEVSTHDCLFAPARQWESVSLYRATRHAHLGSVSAALEADIVQECLRLGLPRPRIDVLTAQSAPGRGLTARVRLIFERAVPGPILIGRDRHFGGGLFVGQIA